MEGCATGQVHHGSATTTAAVRANSGQILRLADLAARKARPRRSPRPCPEFPPAERSQPTMEGSRCELSGGCPFGPDRGNRSCRASIFKERSGIWRSTRACWHNGVGFFDRQKRYAQISGRPRRKKPGRSDSRPLQKAKKTRLVPIFPTLTARNPGIS